MRVLSKRHFSNYYLEEDTMEKIAGVKPGFLFLTKPHQRKKGHSVISYGKNSSKYYEPTKALLFGM